MDLIELFDPIWWLRKWMTDRWLCSREASIFFKACAIALVTVTAYAYLAAVGFSPKGLHGYVYWAAEISADVLIAAGAFGQIMLWLGMWRFWSLLDTSPPGRKKLWFVVLLFGLWYGGAAYYLAVYRSQIAHSGNQAA